MSEQKLLDRIRELEAALAGIMAAAGSVPIARVGDPGTDGFLTCIGCEESGSRDCKPDCWVLGLQHAHDAAALASPQQGGAECQECDGSGLATRGWTRVCEDCSGSAKAPPTAGGSEGT